MTEGSESAGPVARLRDGSSQPLSSLYDTALVDLDGVVYIGPDVVPGAAEALSEARAAGMRIAFVTNNAARTPQAVATHLADLGVPADVTEVVTSAQAAARRVGELVPPGAAVLVVGGEGLEAALRDLGLRPVRTAEDGPPRAVVQGFAPQVGWELLTEGTIAVRRGVPWVASNVDLTIPTPRGPAPGNGALVGVITAATGAVPEVTGKPELGLHREAMLRTGATRPLVVGDRLDTDIEGANRAGVDSLLVLTGVTGPAEVVGAAEPLRPSYLSDTLAHGLLAPHPAVQEQRGEWRCGGWVVRTGADEWDVDGAGDPVDGLRALCAASWSRPAGSERVELSAALGALGW